MAFEIIPEQFYLNVGADNYLDPSWFNSVFNNINSHSMASGRYVRPVQVVANTTQITWKETPASAFDGIYPEKLVFKEIGSDFAPDGWEPTYQWSLSDAPASLYTFIAGSLDTDQEIELEIDSATYDLSIDHSVLSSLASFTITCQVTYTDLNGFVITNVATFGLPLFPLADGKPAVSAPKALIWIDSQHKPLEKPGGFAEFKVENISYYPPDTDATQTTGWSLSYGGISKNNYITDNGDGTATIAIPEVGKTFELQLTAGVPGLTSSVKTINIATYDYGSFLFSSWGQNVPVDPPLAVSITGTNSVNKGTEQLFPGNNGNINVKWGKSLSELSRWNAGMTDLTNNVFCISGLSDNPSYSNAVRAIMSEYGISNTESAENYSLVQLGISDVTSDGAVNIMDINQGTNFIGQSFWAKNMQSSAEILYKTVGDSLVIDGNPFINNAYNSLYLVKGVVPSGEQTDVSVGPGAERYYVGLQSYTLDAGSGIYNLSGSYDQYSVVTQSADASPVSMSFNGIPLDISYKAFVVSANGSAYSLAKYSDSYYKLSSASMASQVITAVVASPSQYGLSLIISTDATMEEPVGYIINYKEISSGVSWPVDSHISKKSSDITVSSLYSVGSKVNINATVGSKVVATVRAVMSDGSTGNPVTIEPVNVSVPWSYLESGVSKSLGRISYTSQANAGTGNTLEHLSPIDNSTGQSNLFATAFGRDIYIEEIVIWVYSSDLNSTNAGPFTVRLQSDSLTDANDEKIVTIASDTETDISITGEIPIGKTKKYNIPDLSIPVMAGSDVIIALQGHSHNSDTIDIEAEIHYSNGTIVTSAAPTPDGTTAGGGY